MGATASNARTLTEIALECRSSSSSDFSRAFKQVYGFSPRHHSRERFLEDSKIRQDLLANAGYHFGKDSVLVIDPFFPGSMSMTRQTVVCLLAALLIGPVTLG